MKQACRSMLARGCLDLQLDTDWLAQLVERQSAAREVEGSSPRPHQHSGF